MRTMSLATQPSTCESRPLGRLKIDIHLHFDGEGTCSPVLGRKHNPQSFPNVNVDVESAGVDTVSFLKR
jgi:hypothetical protein